MTTNTYTPFLFSELQIEKEKAISKKAKEKWQKMKSHNWALDYNLNAPRTGKYGITKLHKYTNDLPQKFITLHEANNMGSPNTGVLGFSYDYELEKLASKPSIFIPKLTRYKCVGEPDFSMKIGDPLASVVSSTYRSHNIAYYLQQQGCNILPTMKWADTASYEEEQYLYQLWEC